MLFLYSLTTYASSFASKIVLSKSEFKKMCSDVQLIKPEALAPYLVGRCPFDMAYLINENINAVVKAASQIPEYDAFSLALIATLKLTASDASPSDEGKFKLDPQMMVSGSFLENSGVFKYAEELIYVLTHLLDRYFEGASIEECSIRGLNSLDRLLLWGGPKRTLSEEDCQSIRDTLQSKPNEFFLSMAELREVPLMRQVLEGVKVKKMHAAGWYVLMAVSEIKYDILDVLRESSDQHHKSTMQTMRKIAQVKCKTKKKSSMREALLNNMTTPKAFDTKERSIEFLNEYALMDIHRGVLLNRHIPRENLLGFFSRLPVNASTIDSLFWLLLRIGRDDSGRNTQEIQHDLSCMPPIFYEALANLGISFTGPNSLKLTPRNPSDAPEHMENLGRRLQIYLQRLKAAKKQPIDLLVDAKRLVSVPELDLQEALSNLPLFLISLSIVKSIPTLAKASDLKTIYGIPDTVFRKPADIEHLISSIVHKRLPVARDGFVVVTRDEIHSHKPTPLDYALLWDPEGIKKWAPIRQILTCNAADFFMALIELEDELVMSNILRENVSVERKHASGWIALMLCSRINPQNILKMLETNGCQHDPQLITLLDALAQSKERQLLELEVNLQGDLGYRLSILKKLKENLQEAEIAKIITERKFFGILLRRDISEESLLKVLRRIPVNLESLWQLQLLLPHVGKKCKHQTIPSQKISRFTKRHPKIFMDACGALGITFAQFNPLLDERPTKAIITKRCPEDKDESLRDLASFLLDLFMLDEAEEDESKKFIVYPMPDKNSIGAEIKENKKADDDFGKDLKTGFITNKPIFAETKAPPNTSQTSDAEKKGPRFKVIHPEDLSSFFKSELSKYANEKDEKDLKTTMPEKKQPDDENETKKKDLPTQIKFEPNKDESAASHQDSQKPLSKKQLKKLAKQVELEEKHQKKHQISALEAVYFSEPVVTIKKDDKSSKTAAASKDLEEDALSSLHKRESAEIAFELFELHERQKQSQSMAVNSEAAPRPPVITELKGTVINPDPVNSFTFPVLPKNPNQRRKKGRKSKNQNKKKGKDKGKDKGKSKGEGEDKSKSKSKGEGEDKSKSKGKGEGEDKSKSKSKGEGEDKSKSKSKGEGEDKSKSKSKGEGEDKKTEKRLRAFVAKEDIRKTPLTSIEELDDEANTSSDSENISSISTGNIYSALIEPKEKSLRKDQKITKNKDATIEGFRQEPEQDTIDSVLDLHPPDNNNVIQKELLETVAVAVETPNNLESDSPKEIPMSPDHEREEQKTFLSSQNVTEIDEKIFEKPNLDAKEKLEEKVEIPINFPISCKSKNVSVVEGVSMPSQLSQRPSLLDAQTLMANFTMTFSLMENTRYRASIIHLIQRPDSTLNINSEGFTFQPVLIGEYRLSNTELGLRGVVILTEEIPTQFTRNHYHNYLLHFSRFFFSECLFVRKKLN